MCIRDREELKLSTNMEDGNTSGVLKDMEKELAASGDLETNVAGGTQVRDRTSTPLQKKKKDLGGFRDWNRTTIESESDTMSQGTTSTKRSRGSRGGGGKLKRKDISRDGPNSQKARKDQHGNKVRIRAPLLDVGPDVGMGGMRPTGKPATGGGVDQNKNKNGDPDAGPTTNGWGGLIYVGGSTECLGLHRGPGQ